MQNTEKSGKHRFFIGANTSDGFVNYSDDIFKGMQKIYIIKGGPGTGKSTFMKYIADNAESLGYRCERYYCSSDSTSLDGILIKEKGIAITDGTAPHVFEPEFPGVCEEIIDFGRFWNEEILRNHGDEIKELCKNKKRLYGAVYKNLGVCGMLKAEERKTAERFTDIPKAASAAERLIKSIGKGKGFKLKARQISALGMNGRTYLNTYSDISDKVIYVSDTRGISGIVFSEILKCAEKNCLEAWISYDPFSEAEALYFPEKKVAVLSGGFDCSASHKIINTERFVIKDKLKSGRAGLRFHRKLISELSDRTEALFSEIKGCHFALETLYSKAMNFKELNDYTSGLLLQIITSEYTEAN